MAPLVSTELVFLVLGGVVFNGYLLVSTFDPPPPPLNHFLCMGPALGGKFAAMRGLRLTMFHMPKGGQSSNWSRWYKKKENVKIKIMSPPPAVEDRNNFHA